MRASDKNLTVLSDAEKEALYGLPDFDDFQRAEYFALTDEERTLAQRCGGIPEQIQCMLQICQTAWKNGQGIRENSVENCPP
jgi:Domain of unknown function (DUF4158)